MSKTFLIVIIFVCGCSTHKPLATSREARWKDVAYGSFPSSKMDIALPANRNAKTPFVIIIHGGAWVLGDKIWGSRTQDSLLLHGIASANINYRFVNDSNIHYQQLLDDIDSALNYCITHARKWNTRKNGFILNGESAGAHLALMHAYTRGDKTEAVISMCAPTNLTDTLLLQHYYKNDISLFRAIENMTGASYTLGHMPDKKFSEASPVMHVKNKPVLIFHGTADNLVPFSQAQALQDTLKQRKYTHTLVPVTGAGHDLGLNTTQGRAFLYNELLHWIQALETKK